MIDKSVLSEVSCVFEPGRFCAIMGSSGAGKTTLLNVLAGYSDAGTVSGTMRINGVELSSEGRREISAFVHQDDMSVNAHAR
jgi:ABC-type multidrug transport system ATPase subunit